MSFYGQAKLSAPKVEKGMWVEVKKGRKVALGTKGEVFWIGQGFMQGMSRFALSVYPIGIRDSKGQVHWTYDSNVQELDPENEGAEG